jgi:hypothetical protein
MTQIAFVYLDNRLPKYAMRNLKYLKKNFPELNLLLVSNNSLNIKYADKIHVPRFEVSNAEMNLHEISETLNHPIDFRKGFWFSTITRFKALEIAVKSLNIENVIHMELDMLILPNFPFDSFQESRHDLIYGSLNEDESIGSILHISNFRSLEKLNNFIATEVKINSAHTDMTLLSKYRIDFPERVGDLNSNTKNPLNHNGVEYIFDIANIGIYLCGQDPRNHKGRTIKRRKLSNHEYDFLKFRMSISNHGIELSSKDEHYQLCSLHIHAKDPRLFATSWPSKMLVSNVNKVQEPEESTLAIRIYVSLALKKIKKILGQPTKKR